MSNNNLTSSIQPVRVYVEPKSTADALERRYWRQSNEAEAVGHPYVVIQPKAKYAHVTCDWITANNKNGSDPVVMAFATSVKWFIPFEYPGVRIKSIGSYTVIDRVPRDQAEMLAADLAAIATSRLRQEVRS